MLSWEIGLIMIIIGVLLLMAEASAPGFFIAVPATILIVLGVVGLIAPALLLTIWSPIIVVAITIPITVLTILLYQRIAPPEPPTTTVGYSLLGKVGKVTTDIIPDTIKGKVQIENQVWSATANEPIPVGTKVKVIGSRGVHVFVQRLE